MAQNTGGKNFWGFMQTLVVDSGLAAAAGEAVATHVPAVARSQLATAAGESVARSLRRSALEVVPPSELGLVLLASRLTNLAYCATTPEAIAAGVSTLLVQSSLVWFKQQDPHSGTHDAQWYLARGTLPPGVDGAAPGGPALFLVFRGTQSMNDVMNDVMATPKAAASGGMFHEVSTTSIPSPNASPNPNPNPNPAPRGLPACGGGGRRAARATRRARRGQAPCTRHARAVAHAMHTPCTCHAHAMHVPCTCHAHAMQIACAAHVVGRLCHFGLQPPLPMVAACHSTSWATRSAARSLSRCGVQSCCQPRTLAASPWWLSAA